MIGDTLIVVTMVSSIAIAYRDTNSIIAFFSLPADHIGAWVNSNAPAIYAGFTVWFAVNRNRVARLIVNIVDISAFAGLTGALEIN